MSPAATVRDFHIFKICRKNTQSADQKDFPPVRSKNNPNRVFRTNLTTLNLVRPYLVRLQSSETYTNNFDSNSFRALFILFFGVNSDISSRLSFFQRNRRTELFAVFKSDDASSIAAASRVFMTRIMILIYRWLGIQIAHVQCLFKITSSFVDTVFNYKVTRILEQLH